MRKRALISLNSPHIFPTYCLLLGEGIILLDKSGKDLFLDECSWGLYDALVLSAV